MTEESTFDQTLKALEERVRELERSELPLDQALSTYEEGVALARTAHKQLDAAEQRISALVRGADGIGEEPLDEPSDL